MKVDYNKADFETSFGTPSQLTESTLPEIVFVGRSNVGKSSLLNKLFNRKSLARVSSEPGKTVTINFYLAGDARFVDLPGYGFAKRPAAEKKRWADLIDHYFTSDRNIKLVVSLIDMRHKPTKDDITMLDFLLKMDLPFLVVLTKADKLKVKARQAQKDLLKQELLFIDRRDIIEVSSTKGDGIGELKEAIEAALREENI